MRRVLIDHARARNAAKRGGERRAITWIEPPASPGSDPIDVLALDEALGRLARLSERQAQVVELRFFGGLTMEEVAGELGVSKDTVKLDWRAAREWLSRELGGAGLG